LQDITAKPFPPPWPSGIPAEIISRKGLGVNANVKQDGEKLLTKLLEAEGKKKKRKKERSVPDKNFNSI
ncbi:hypothetical protein N331_01160, partial [Merops nubicus]